MSTDKSDSGSVPKLLGFRPTAVMLARLEAWQVAYAQRTGVGPDSVTMQFTLPYLLNLALAAEGIANGEVER